MIIKGKKGNLSINESLLECPTANVAKLFIPLLTTLNKPIGIKGTKKVLDDLKQYQQRNLYRINLYPYLIVLSSFLIFVLLINFQN